MILHMAANNLRCPTDRQVESNRRRIGCLPTPDEIAFIRQAGAGHEKTVRRYGTS